MKKLSKAQSYGLVAMVAGYVLHLAIVIPFPDAKLLGLLAWGVAFVGAGVYTIATFPATITWLHKFWGDKGASGSE
jgi:hypothetical protein